jgi:hypothetical protein
VAPTDETTAETDSTGGNKSQRKSIMWTDWFITHRRRPHPWFRATKMRNSIVRAPPRHVRTRISKAAETSFRNASADRLKRRHVAHLEDAPEPRSGSAVGLDHGVDPFRRDFQRLLAQNVLAGARRRQAPPQVRAGWRGGPSTTTTSGPSQHGLQRIAGRAPELGGEGLGARAVADATGDEPRARRIATARA